MFVVLDDTACCDPSVNFMLFILCINNYLCKIFNVLMQYNCVNTNICLVNYFKLSLR